MKGPGFCFAFFIRTSEASKLNPFNPFYRRIIGSQATNPSPRKYRLASDPCFHGRLCTTLRPVTRLAFILIEPLRHLLSSYQRTVSITPTATTINGNLLLCLSLSNPFIRNFIIVFSPLVLQLVSSLQFFLMVYNLLLWLRPLQQ